MRFGGLELVVILVIFILVFGPKQLPKVTAAIKNSLSSFKKGKEEEIADEGQDKKNI